MDNFHIDVTSEGAEGLLFALRIAFRGRKARGYRVVEGKGLVFFSEGNKSDYSELPFQMEHNIAADFVWQWLKEADYGKEPNHDGDNGKGWRVYVDSWGRVSNVGGGYSICAVAPAWAMYGK